MQPGVIPYSVNSPLWSDGAHKERFLAIPHKAGQGHADRASARNRGWDFPDETVLVKSFALETDAGRSGQPPLDRDALPHEASKANGSATRTSGTTSRPTRNWSPAKGLDREYEIACRVARESGRPEQQTWHYPSRTECMVCHSRAANFVLGLTELQMNKDHDYGGGHVENQLARAGAAGAAQAECGRRYAEVSEGRPEEERA